MKRILALFFWVLTLVYAAPMLADQSVATLSLSGMVPAYFSVVASGVQGFLDLSSRVVVANHSIGIVHFKYNENVQSLVVSSSTLSGAPENSSGTPYQFAAGGAFQVAFMAGCQTVDPTYNTPFFLTNVGVDVKSPLSAALVNSGIEENCQMLVSYKGTTVSLPLAGLYSMDIVVTMISQ